LYLSEDVEDAPSSSSSDDEDHETVQNAIEQFKKMYTDPTLESDPFQNEMSNGAHGARPPESREPLRKDWMSINIPLPAILKRGILVQLHTPAPVAGGDPGSKARFFLCACSTLLLWARHEADARLLQSLDPNLSKVQEPDPGVADFVASGNAQHLLKHHSKIPADKSPRVVNAALHNPRPLGSVHYVAFRDIDRIFSVGNTQYFTVNVAPPPPEKPTAFTFVTSSKEECTAWVDALRQYHGEVLRLFAALPSADKSDPSKAKRSTCRQCECKTCIIS